MHVPKEKEVLDFISGILNSRSAQLLVEVFGPDFLATWNEHKIKNGGRFVHYTTAENALRILSGQEFWLRNTRVMHDFSEVQYGYGLMRRFFADADHHERFCKALNACGENLGPEVLKTFDDLFQHLLNETYIGCVSAHLPSEDAFGRLSMWRAFGVGTAGVAIVLNPLGKNLLTPGIAAAPVMYATVDDVYHRFTSVIRRIEERTEELRTLKREAILMFSYMLLAFGAVATKHPAFAEEREWRLIYLPTQFPSPHVDRKVESIAGIPQAIQKLRFKGHVKGGAEGLEIKSVLDRVIIGPSQYSRTIYSAFVEVLAQIGVSDPMKKVVVSNVPIRG